MKLVVFGHSTIPLSQLHCHFDGFVPAFDSHLHPRHQRSLLDMSVYGFLTHTWIMQPYKFGNKKQVITFMLLAILVIVMLSAEHLPHAHNYLYLKKLILFLGLEDQRSGLVRVYFKKMDMGRIQVSAKQHF